MNDDNRQARVLAFQQSQTLSDRAKITEIETAAAQAFYRTYGKRLTQMMRSSWRRNYFNFARINCNHQRKFTAIARVF